MTGSAQILHANSRHLPLADNTVDLILTSPPYFALRSYQDGGEHYAGQVGDEATPAAFVASLLEVTRECMRVLKPSGSMFVNLGDKYNSSAKHNNGVGSPEMARPSRQTTDGAGIPAKRLPVLRTVPTKSLIGIPWRYALACIDDLGLILRAEIIWSKPNGLPESVTDRVRRSHEQWFHFTLEPRYYSAVDEIREAHVAAPRASGKGQGQRIATHLLAAQTLNDDQQQHPLGKLPGSVWTVATEPLQVPDHLGVDHFAAYPTEWPRRIIQGWSPAGVCVACGEGRRPVAERRFDGTYNDTQANKQRQRSVIGGGTARVTLGMTDDVVRTITGYACACPTPDAPTTPSVILDPFGGTGTTALVAKALGRHGITVDMSADYCRLATWRCNDPQELAKAARVVRSDAARAADTLDMDPLFDWTEPA